MQPNAADSISSEYRNWPHVLWERVGFDGVRRWSTGAEDTPAAAANARLPRHPAMELGDNGTVPAITTPPSLLPCRRDAALQILTEEQRNEMDYRGFVSVLAYDRNTGAMSAAVTLWSQADTTRFAGVSIRL
eukprot:COSAG02_NODE_16092_length_1114_cov_0.957635_2_plen_132_part_00